ncbi:hypothetical protein NZK35_08450 [Stieleria sp. ICT_E10.1]|uniref:hypothetical protein n=1 Tax=Stieleria sedimenti TaxID=2976331 RepID=UPI00217FF780|nr:hypothetical protein [Stieleria sedimenti]MCS7466671.1 hypothetical protein [Stieleria sedimenti]
MRETNGHQHECGGDPTEKEASFHSGYLGNNPVGSAVTAPVTRRVIILKGQ